MQIMGNRIVWFTNKGIRINLKDEGVRSATEEDISRSTRSSTEINPKTTIRRYKITV